MAVKRVFEIEHRFKASFEDIYLPVLDLKKFGELHPHMKVVNILSQHKTNEVEYEIFEEIYLLGFIKNKPYYKATVIEIEKNKLIQYASQVKKNIQLKIDFTFTENKEQNSLVLKEVIEVTCNKFIGSIFLNILKKAHLQLFDKLREDIRGLTSLPLCPPP